MVVILMGVTGSGKTTIGRQLARELGWRFYDADDFHPAANVEKMSRGVPLEDRDRAPWLDALRELVSRCLESGESAVLACSALKGRYRDHLLVDEDVRLVHLKGDYELIRARLDGREGHFMKGSMLGSQFAALEEPERALAVDVSPTPAEIVKTIRDGLGV